MTWLDGSEAEITGERALDRRTDRTDARGSADVEQVRDVLAHLYDPGYLQSHPLARARVRDITRPRTNPGRDLRDLLLEAIAELRPASTVAADSPPWRTYQILTLRYVDALDVPTILGKLAISRSAFFRDHRRALEAVAALLGERRGQERETAVPDAIRSIHALPPLPVHLTSFIGRERELLEVSRVLGTSRLVTLTGTGGSGKTRLAFAVAGAVAARFPDGVGVVELAGVTDPTFVAPTVAARLGLRERADQPLLTVLTAYLRPLRLLLVLDNCEHLLDGCAHLIDALLRGCPDVRILATSREALRVAGETVFLVPLLDVPPASPVAALSELVQFDAVRLFVDRARAADGGFTLSAANGAAVGAICRRLDGLPFAVELAAALVQALSVEAIAERLTDRFRLLRHGMRMAEPRQRTLEATIGWSYSLLSEPERMLFRRLAVFLGGFTLEAAEAVGSDPPLAAEDVLDCLTGLVEKSLVMVGDRASQVKRYWLLETLRQYGWERLIEAGEAPGAQDRHRDWCVALAEQAASEIVQHDQGDWLDRIERDHDNLRAALAWCLASDRAAGIRLAGGLWRFWRGRGYVTEGRRWLSAVLSSLPYSTLDVDEALRGSETPGTGKAIHVSRARALLGAGNLALDQGDYREAQSLVAQSLILYRAAEDRVGTAHALRDLAGIMLLFGGESEQIRSALDESLAVARDAGDERGIGLALLNLGRLAAIERDGRRATSLAEDSLIQFRRLGDDWSAGQALWALGWLAWIQGDREQAQRNLREHLDSPAASKTNPEWPSGFWRWQSWPAQRRTSGVPVNTWREASDSSRNWRVRTFTMPLESPVTWLCRKATSTGEFAFWPLGRPDGRREVRSGACSSQTGEPTGSRALPSPDRHSERSPSRRLGLRARR